MRIPSPQKARIRGLKQQLALNITAALCVAGSSRSGKPDKLRQVDVMRRTGMSRTTLRPLLDANDPSQRNPDLVTLHKLAHVIGVPLAFLLMTPEDWRSLTRAIGEFAHNHVAADRLIADELGKPVQAEDVLRACKVHPERPPLGADYDPLEVSRLEARNEWRRRCSLVLAALAQPSARGNRKYLVELTALAAALANEMTPHNPDSADDRSVQERT